jgi:hypothetical protein
VSEAVHLFRVIRFGESICRKSNRQENQQTILLSPFCCLTRFAKLTQRGGLRHASQVIRFGDSQQTSDLSLSAEDSPLFTTLDAAWQAFGLVHSRAA